MLGLRAIVLATLLLAPLWRGAATARTHVDIASTSQVRIDLKSEQFTRIECYPMAVDAHIGDIIKVDVQSSRGVALQTAVLIGGCDALSQPQFIQSLLDQTQYPAKNDFQAMQDGPVGLLVKSAYWMPLTHNIITGPVVISHTLTPQERAAAAAAMQRYADYVDGRFITPDFTIRFRPCDVVNAFTDLDSGDITLCTELMKSGVSPNLQFAIFLHELGHSLLSRWNEPGYKLESTCDDFAAALLLKEPNGGIGAVEELAEYFEKSQIPWIMQFSEIVGGDPHPPNIQRANLLRGDIFGSTNDFERGWNRTFYRHMRSQWLAQLQNHNFEDWDLAQAQLNRQ